MRAAFSLKMTPLLLVLALTVPAAATPPRLTIADPFAAAREAAARGDWQAVRERLGEKDGKPPALVAAPGLYGRALVETGDRGRACRLYGRDARENALRSEAAQLRFARCVTAEGAKKQAVAAWLSVLGGEVLARDVLVADEAVTALAKLGFDKEAAARAKETGWAKAKPAAADTLRREALARVLLAMVEAERDASARKALLETLYVELGETPAAETAMQHKDARALASHKDAKLALARAEELTTRHDNAGVFATLKPHAPGPKDLDEPACTIRVLQGKAARKLRRYSTARRNLDVAATQCSGDPQRRAQYLNAQVAYYQGSKDALRLIETFVKAHPTGNLTDDALFWKAEILERRGQLDEAEATYKRLADSFPDGDMREDARFNHAFSRALRRDPQGARALLDEIARTVKGTDAKEVMARDRALFWRARLSLFPDPKALDPTSDKKQQHAGHDALLAFAKARPASYYGHVARLLALYAAPRLGRDVKATARDLDAARAARRTALDDGQTIPVSARLQRDDAFALALQLAGAGYDNEAELLLDTLDTKALSADERVVVTLLYAQVGGLPKSHQVMRFSGHALLPGKPTQDTLLAWHLGWPRAHEDALIAGAEATGRVPPLLLMGLAREESAFNADVVSWAGAIGLCQLMPFTAKEEAQILKLGDPSLEELREPELNARLGGNHLSRRMKLLGHPWLAIAAYNAGPGNVAKWRKPGDPKPIDAWVESIPVAQTRHYVKKVYGSWVVYEALDGDIARLTVPVELP